MSRQAVEQEQHSDKSKSKSSLRILPEEAPLRGRGPFVEEMPWSDRAGSERGENEPPRALRGLAKIIDGGLCHRCGSCIGICPTNVLELDRQDYPTIKSLSACTDCDLCVKVCPGDEFDFDARAPRAAWNGRRSAQAARALRRGIAGACDVSRFAREVDERRFGDGYPAAFAGNEADRRRDCHRFG